MAEEKEKKLTTSKIAWKRGLPVKDDDALIRSVVAKFMVPKKTAVKTPYVPPEEQDLFQYIGKSQRQLHRDLIESGEPPRSASQAQRKDDVRRRGREKKMGDQLGPPTRRQHIGGPVVQPLTTREYLQAARATAREKNLAHVAEIEAERLEEELSRERGKNTHLEKQLDKHQEALEQFLQYHYHSVSEAIYKGEEAKRNLTEQEIRINYFSGLLAEARTVQEEEEERLEELTAFQQFLAAVAPSQSLRDLKRRMQEIHQEILESESESTAESDADRALASSSSAADKCGASVVMGEGSGGGSLGADLLALRMIKPDHPDSLIPTNNNPSTVHASVAESLDGKVDDEEDDKVGEEDDKIDSVVPQDSGNFAEEFLNDETYLAKLSGMYESQCHSLFSLLTRLQNQTEAIGKEMEGRQSKLETRLNEIQQLQEKARGSGHTEQLKDLQTLITEWPRVSGDEGAWSQLQQLVGQIAEVVSDVFGSSKYSPLVPQSQPPESPTIKSSNGQKGTNEKPTEEIKENETKGNAGMGQEALLALLEARVTDLCAELDTIDPHLRDSIFLNCEQARAARLKEEKRLQAETRRAERKQKHLERALAEPPQRPL